MPVTQLPGIVVYQETVYDVREDGSVHQFLGLGKGWKTLDGNNTLSQFAVGDTFYHFLTSKFLFGYMTADKTWKKLDQNSESKGIAASSRFLYQFDSVGRVGQYNGRGWNVIDEGRQPIAIAADVDDTKVYQLHGSGAISQYISSQGWKEIDSTPGVRTIVAEGGRLFKIHNDGSLYVHKVAYSWDMLDNTGDTVQVSAGSAGVYQRRGDGSVLHYDETGQKWDKIQEGNGQVMAIAVGKQVYARKKDKSVVFFDGKNWHALV